MKKLIFIAIASILLFSCKKEQPTTFLGRWSSNDFQFTIENLDGVGKYNTFKKEGNKIIFVFNNETTYTFEIVMLAQYTMVLKENGVNHVFHRF